MEGCAFFRTGNFVTYVDSDGITPISFNGWSWECTVDKDNASVHSIRRDVATSDIEVVRGTLVSCESCQPRRLWTEDQCHLPVLKSVL